MAAFQTSTNITLDEILQYRKIDIFKQPLSGE